ncbi:MAG: methylenetetrahydrofolate reductase [Candidatus Margulisbacteria bacterium]|nr:methylenetetrahydrofolate reductase [Candidatus Margulisiibacteriota bacterium]MBU1022333.1 methylenetetrahydrofolate reductase [Candidatus Margulisiibacteriota bacterium]MBU1729583.1 methylenetetrahydrofolate reductase [Candidatus Margulisiibacteriota bacterium]MBU1955069.1 methylenetetrahydrofolate reductase [Candidatus Margulisiibacteriota bacterium]
MTLKEALNSGKFVITVEICPPKGTEVEPILSDAEVLLGKVDAINVTDNQRAMMRLSGLAFCRLLLEKGFDPIFQLTCRDRNSLALQSDILGAYVLGIRNILALSGDYPSKGDHKSARPVFDLDSVQLVETIKKLEKGENLAGEKINGHPKFTVGAVVNPGAVPIEPQIIKLKKKVEAGAEFIQTQVIYDVEIFKKFLHQLNMPKLKILAGIFPLKSFKMAQFMNEKVPGVSVPESILKRMEFAQNPEEEGVKIAKEIIEEVKPLCAGIHIMALNDVNLVLKLI